MSLELETSQIEEAVQFIKEHIHKKHNCRVGWALRMKFGKPYEKSFHNIEKVAKAIIATNEYVKENSLQYPQDFSISKNPLYKPEHWTKKYPFAFEVVKVVIGIVAAIITAYITTHVTFNSIKNDSDSNELKTERSYKPPDSLKSSEPKPQPKIYDTPEHLNLKVPKDS